MEPWEAAAQAPKALEPWEAASQQPGIGTRLLGDLQNRIAAGNEIANDPNRSALVKVPQYVGKVGAGLANDAIGEVIKSGVDAIPQPVKDAAGAAAAAIVPDSYNRAVNNSIEGGKKIYNNLSPETKDSLDAAGNVVGLGANLAGGVGLATKAGELASGARAAVNAASDAATPLNFDWSKIKPENVPDMNSDQLRDISHGIYKKAEQAGGALSADFTNQFVDDITKAASEHIKTPEDAAQAAAWRLKNPAADLISSAQDAKNLPMSLGIAQKLDQQLGDLVHDNVNPDGTLSSTGREYSIIQSKLRSAIKNAPESQFIGGKAGFDASVDARKAWMYQAQLRDIERIETKALGQQQPGAAMQRGFYSYYTNPARSGSLEPNDFMLAKKAGSKNIGADILNTTGSGLVPYVTTGIGGAAGNIPGAIAGAAVGKAISMASKAGSEFLQDAPVKALKKSLVSKSLGLAAKYK